MATQTQPMSQGGCAASGRDHAPDQGLLGRKVVVKGGNVEAHLGGHLPGAESLEAPCRNLVEGSQDQLVLPVFLCRCLRLKPGPWTHPNSIKHATDGFRLGSCYSLLRPLWTEGKLPTELTGLARPV